MGKLVDLMVLTRPAAWCSYSSCTASSPPPSCTWLCIWVPPCGWWTSLPGWSLWSALPPLSDILHTNMQIKLILVFYHLVFFWKNILQLVMAVKAVDQALIHPYIFVMACTTAAFAKRKCFCLFKFEFSSKGARRLKVQVIQTARTYLVSSQADIFSFGGQAFEVFAFTTCSISPLQYNFDDIFLGSYQ